MRADMLTIWRCVSPSIPDHIYRYGPVWTATDNRHYKYAHAAISERTLNSDNADGNAMMHTLLEKLVDRL